MQSCRGCSCYGCDKDSSCDRYVASDEGLRRKLSTDCEFSSAVAATRGGGPGPAVTAAVMAVPIASKFIKKESISRDGPSFIVPFSINYDVVFSYQLEFSQLCLLFLAEAALATQAMPVEPIPGVTAPAIDAVLARMRPAPFVEVVRAESMLQAMQIASATGKSFWALPC